MTNLIVGAVPVAAVGLLVAIAWRGRGRPAGSIAHCVVGGLAVVHGTVLGLFWTGILVGSAYAGPTTKAVLIGLTCGAVAWMLVLTGLALLRGAAWARPLAFATAALLLTKAAAAGYAAGTGLAATGRYSRIEHHIGWLLLAVVVVPSLVAAACLVAVTFRARPPAGAADYDDAPRSGRADTPIA